MPPKKKCMLFETRCLRCGVNTGVPGSTSHCWDRWERKLLMMRTPTSVSCTKILVVETYHGLLGPDLDNTRSSFRRREDVDSLKVLACFVVWCRTTVIGFCYS